MDDGSEPADQDQSLGDAYAVADGYQGIWFTLGQLEGPHGDKYVGGLGTYTAKHVPMAVFDDRVDRTFFTYGAAGAHARDLQIAVGSYDHASHAVTRPTIVDAKDEPDEWYDSDTVVDPHDNASLLVDDAGYVHVFVSGRGRIRPGRHYRSHEPWQVAAFEQVNEWDTFAYPQPWQLDERFLCCFTIYDETGTRELFWRTSDDGEVWSEPAPLARIGGHYQVSESDGERVVTALNWHPEGDVDQRTNLYVLETRDAGQTWQTIDDTPIEVPLEEANNPALVDDLAARDRLVYLKDLAFDAEGHPVVLTVTAASFDPGPSGDPRYWRVTRWTGEEWRHARITDAGHNYDTGCLHLDPECWRVVGPTEPGDQSSYCGGEMAVWRSDDRGASWSLERQLTADSPRHHNYARRPRNASAPFHAFWADGDPRAESDSRLYFADVESGSVSQLPAAMNGETGTPAAYELPPQ